MKTKQNDLDYVKANRRGSRDAEFEQTNNGWSSKNKVHTSKKNYDRKRDKGVELC